MYSNLRTRIGKDIFLSSSISYTACFSATETFGVLIRVALSLLVTFFQFFYILFDEHYTYN